MSPELWTAVDTYLADKLLVPDPGLEAARRENASAGLPAIDVSPLQGKLLHLLAQIQGARRILELGTLGGYSTIWLAQALPPGGMLVTLEAEPKHATVAARNLERAGLLGQVRIVIGRALETLPKLAAERSEPFDFIFIDADKVNTAEYVEWAIKLGRPGSVLVIDNVIRKGAVVDEASADESVRGMRRFLDQIARNPKLDATGIQTVGTKGYDGFVLARITA